MDEISRIRSALAYLDASMSRHEWINIGMAINSEFGDKGFQIFDEWSKTASNYNAADARDAWKSFKPNGPVKIGTLIKKAKGQGWQDPGKPNPTTSDDLSKQRNAERAAAEEDKLKAKRAKAAQKALEVWMQATPAQPDHPYLLRKAVQPTGTLRELDANRVKELLGYPPKSDGKPLSGRILIAPVKVSGKISTLEMIDESGRKSALAGGAKGGGFWATGPIKDGAQSDQIVLIAEGVATATSGAQATGHIAVAALSLGNLAKTASAIRKELPAARIVLLADLDKKTGKPCADAEKAALSVNGLCIAPDFGGERAENETDFNDLSVSRGLTVVAEQINKLLQIAAAGNVVPEGGKFSRAKSNPSGKSNSSETLYHPYLGGRFEVNADGVRFAEKKDDGGWHKGVLICSRLDILGATRDEKGTEWGRLLEWKDSDGKSHQWAVPVELLQTDGSEVRRELARQGLNIEPSKTARDRLSAYIQVWPTERRMRCVERLGWVNGAYVLPSGAVGNSEEHFVFQSPAIIEPAFETSGTLTQWQESVCKYAKGNSRLMFAISSMFAPTLLDLAGEDGGGFHLLGGSSNGKTTTLRIASSVWGSPARYPRTWRATSSGLEGLATVHNDCALVLDEISQMDQSDAGNAAYMLANGEGRLRAGRTGAAKKVARWKLIFLSSGEDSVETLLTKAGKQPMAGQEIRLANIAADAGSGLGTFEFLHGFDTPSSFAESLKESAIKHHGSAGIAWLEYVVSNRAKIQDSINQRLTEFVESITPVESSGQVYRVARRFGLVALAGELATLSGVTNWNAGEATAAVRKCFFSWLELFGGSGDKESRTVVENVSNFISLHGSARFETLKDRSNDPRTINRVGFYVKKDDGSRHYWVFPNMLTKEICPGYQANVITSALLKAGILIPSKNGNTKQTMRLPGIGTPTKFYVLRYHDGTDEAAELDESIS